MRLGTPTNQIVRSNLLQSESDRREWYLLFDPPCMKLGRKTGPKGAHLAHYSYAPFPPTPPPPTPNVNLGYQTV